jgi:class 3 adenylate cyclase
MMSLESRFADVKLRQSKSIDCAIVMFDLSNFSNISITLRRREVIQILSEVFAYTSDAVARYNGIVERFPGDGVIACFPTVLGPEELSDVVEASLDCATEVMFWVYENLSWCHDLVRPSHKLAMSVGIDAGNVAVVRLGSTAHSELVLVGNQVNAASKCEQHARPGEIVVGDNAAGHAGIWHTKRMETGPSLGLIWRETRTPYRSHRFDWRSHADKWPGIRRDGLFEEDDSD